MVKISRKVGAVRACYFFFETLSLHAHINMCECMSHSEHIAHEIYLAKSESILLFVTNITALKKVILYTFTSYLPHSQSQAVPALPGQNSMPIG